MLPKFLKQSYPLEKHFFLVPSSTLAMIGFNPETDRTTKVNLWALFNFGILVYGCYAEFYYGVHYLSINVATALDALCPVASSIMACVKLFFVWRYREQFKNLIAKVRTLTALNKTFRQVQTKKRYYTFATCLSTTVTFLGFVTSTSYTLRPIIKNTMLYMQGKDILYETPFNMMFPKALVSMPLYPITFLMVHWHGYITVLAFAGVDSLFLGFCTYFGTLFKALQEDIDNILTDFNDKRLFEDQLCLKLKEIVRRHNEIADLTEQFSLIMVEVTFGQYLSSSIIVATSFVDLLLFSGFGALLYMVHTCAVFLEICLYSVGGHIVMESSEDLATVAYNSEWYTHSLKIQKMVLLIIIRAQRTIRINVPFFEPSLPALTSIIRFTGSVVALVKSVV